MAGHAHKFHLLDGLRGLAACVIVWFHLALPGFRHGYLAVDFFFMLSGFVIAFAYQQKLDEGFGFWDFMAVRAARLYPLYLLGLVLGFLFAVTQHSVGTGHPSLARTSASLGLGMVGLPSPASLQGGDTHLFPLNLVLWSLFFEVIANVGHAVLLRRRSTAALVAVVAAVGAGLVMLAAATGGLDVGARTATIGGGLLRVTFGYGMGVLLFRVWKRQAVRWSVPSLLPTLLLLAVLDAPLWGWGVDAFAVVAVLPCVLLLSACAPVGRRSIGVCNLLGTTSYAVYVLHLPLIWAIAATVKHLHLALPDAAFKPVLLVGMFAVAWGVDRTYDSWARTRLKRLLFLPMQTDMAHRFKPWLVRHFPVRAAEFAAGPSLRHEW